MVSSKVLSFTIKEGGYAYPTPLVLSDRLCAPTSHGYCPEKFVNLCISRGIYLWGIAQDDQGILLSMGASNFRLLRPIARSTRCRKNLAKKGLPFYCLRLQGRQMLVLWAASVFTTLYGLGYFIWSIEFRAYRNPYKQKILVEIYNRGVKIRALKRNIDLDELSANNFKQSRFGLGKC